MAAHLTQIGQHPQGRQLSPDEIFAISLKREVALSRLLIAYIVAGVVFMLLPGTFLGVWNLISISSREAAESMSPAWIQAHGHAQVFGWIGTFILGIGFHSIPKLRRSEPFALWTAWACFALWVSGVTMRWFASVYAWHWRALLPVSAVFEVLAFVLFFRAVAGHRAHDQQGNKRAFEPWIFVVIAATTGLMATLAANLWGSVAAALHGSTPAFPAEFDQRYLAVMAWGFMTPFVWGFSSRWLPTFLSLAPPRMRLLLAATAANFAGIVAIAFGSYRAGTVLILAAALASGFALRLWDKPLGPAKTKGIHTSFPVFVRLAYVWLVIAAALGVWAAISADATGIWGASRHALTVGFIAMMVFCIGQRVLPAFGGMRLLYSTRAMFAGLALLTTGCILRVTSEILAYQHILQVAWKWLPVSAVTELAAVSVFAFNLVATFASKPPSAALPHDRRVA